MKMAKFSLSLLTLALVGTLLMPGFSGASDTKSTASPSAAELISGDPQDIPIPGMVTMVDVGAKSCIPCKMMIPLIEELSKEYEGRAAIAFIDVWVNQGEIDKYEIQAIPTQIFYDANGIERYRHVGFLSKEAIIQKLTELGVK